MEQGALRLRREGWVMSELPKISEAAIRERVGSRSFDRGYSYFRHGAIFDARRQGMTLKARCEGSSADAYRVEATLGEAGITGAYCSCPVGGGGGCKHVAALLLTWNAQPETFVEVEALETALERRSKEELIALIRQMLRQEPELELLLETPLPVAGESAAPVEPESFRRQAAAVFRRAGHEWGAAMEIAAGLTALKTIGDGFLAQQQYAAAAVYRGLVEETLDQFGSIEDESGDLASFVVECGEGLGACLAATEDAATRAAILETLFAIFRQDTQIGGVGLSDGVYDILTEQTTAQERRMLADRVRAELPSGGQVHRDWVRQSYGALLLDLEAETLDDESYLRICRETGRRRDLVDRLLALGRLKEAADEARQVGDYALIELANLFVAHGQAETGERLMAERAPRTQDTRVLEWLKERRAARQDSAGALELAEQIFRTRPSLEGYREIRALAAPGDEWERLRPALLKFLAERQFDHLLIDIYLDEGEIDRAIALVETPLTRHSFLYGYGESKALQVARAVEAARPEAALAIYQREVTRRIEQRGRGNYQEACQLLERVRALYERLGQREQWERYIDDLRDRYRGLRALKEEMAHAKL